MFQPATQLKKRGRGNPNWGKPIPPTAALLTEFEEVVKRLGLVTADYGTSAELKRWCQHNKNRAYVPEWLLEQWGMTVEDTFSGVA